MLKLHSSQSNEQLVSMTKMDVKKRHFISQLKVTKKKKLVTQKGTKYDTFFPPPWNALTWKLLFLLTGEICKRMNKKKIYYMTKVQMKRTKCG